MCVCPKHRHRNKSVCRLDEHSSGEKLPVADTVLKGDFNFRRYSEGLTDSEGFCMETDEI